MPPSVPKKAKKTAALARREPPSRRSKAPRAELVPKHIELDDAAAAYAGAGRAERGNPFWLSSALRPNRAKYPSLHELIKLPLNPLGEPGVVDDDAGFD